MKLSRNTIIGLVAVAAVGYYIYDRRKKGKGLNPFSSFAGKMDSAFNFEGQDIVMSGQSTKDFAGKQDSGFFNATGTPIRGTKKATSLYTAGGYDANHMNGDGTRGATWVGYNNDNTQGYWVKGQIGRGTRM